jgi:Lrp/AsnC family leucine-responsive transcriptional regulator
MIDETDKKIIDILQANSRTPNAEIARLLNMAPSSVFERIKQLESKKIITGYSINLNFEKLGCNQIAFISIKTKERSGEITVANKLCKIPEVQEIHHIAGDDCYLLKVRVKDNQALAKLMREKIGNIESITSTRTTIVLENIKETNKIILE